MKQIALDLGAAAKPSFETFVAGRNAAVLEHLRNLGAARASLHRAPVYIWGPAGCGKTHLLHALAEMTLAAGGSVGWFDAATDAPWNMPEGTRLVVLDDCDRFDDLQSHGAFALFVTAAADSAGPAVVASGRVPPVDLRLRDDLRTRLGWGLVFEIAPLDELGSREVLRREARRRGLVLGDEVIGYLLNHFERDLKSLMAMLDRLDAFALIAKRAVTLPLLRQMLKEEAVQDA